MAAAALMASCSNSDETDRVICISPPEELVERRDIVLNDAEKRMAAEHTDFAFSLLKTADEQLADNSQLVFSPLSASMALSMLAEGAGGETRQELLTTLGFAGFTAEEVNAYNKKLMEELPMLDNTAMLGIANSIWLNEGFDALASFRKAMADSYGAETRTEDFALPQTLDLINAWGAEKTNGLIPHFLDELSAELEMVLLNALYFKGAWSIPFDKADTRTGSFACEDGSTAEVKLMGLEAPFMYGVGEGYAVAELPYGNGAYSLCVLLPDAGISLTECLSRLTADAWEAALGSMKYCLLDVQLPKFKLERKDLLTETLRAMGIQKAFTSEADFSNLAESPLSISLVMQANNFSIDEEGVEAAAITGTGLVTGAGGATPSVTSIPFHVTRPFLFVLKEKSTDTILFLGKITSLR